MKTLLRTLIILASTISAVASTDSPETPCSKFLKCGVYAGTGTDFDGDKKVEGNYSERVEIIATGELSALMHVWVKHERRDRAFNLSIKIKFEKDGRFTGRFAKNDGRIFLTGICRKYTCIFSYMARNDLPTPIGNTNIFHFLEDGRLIRKMMTSHATIEAGSSYQLSSLEKQ